MTVGGTLRRTFALLGRDLPAFLGLALVLDLLPRLAVVVWTYGTADPAVSSLPEFARSLRVCEGMPFWLKTRGIS